MKYDIHKTAVVPYIVAERALWNVIEDDKRFDTYSPEQCADLVSKHYPALVEKAETLFQKSTHFRMKLLDKRKDIRYTLKMFMEHWALALLDKTKKDEYKNQSTRQN